MREIKEKYIANYIYYFLIFTSICLIPVYLFESGGLQLSHAILAVFSLIYILQSRIFYEKDIVIFLLFSLYCALIEFIAFVSGNESFSYLPVIYNFFNLMIVTCFFSYLCSRDLAVLKYPIFGSLLVAFFGVLYFGFSLSVDSDAGRSVGTFNNPNQLGYYAVCMSCIGYILYIKGVINRLMYVAIVFLVLFLAITSLSKAAMIAVFLPAILNVVPRRISIARVVILFGVLISVFLIYWSVEYIDILSEFRFYERLAGAFDESDSSLESRGYFAFLDGGIFGITFGMGSAGIMEIVGHEVHSTFGSVLNAYGIFGFILFFSIFFSLGIRIYRAFGAFAFLQIWVPPVLYGLTHNGIRFTIFWVLYAVTLAALKSEDIRRVKRGFGTLNEMSSSR